MAWTCGCGTENESPSNFCSSCGGPRLAPHAASGAPPEGGSARPPGSPSPPAPSPPERKKRVFILGSLSAMFILLGCCLAGICSAVLIPRFLEGRQHARERLRQEGATADMRRIAACCETYAALNHHYPLVADAEPGAFNMTVGSELRRILLAVPCGAACPTLDPWGTEYQYGVTADGESFILVCYALGGRESERAVPQTHVGTHCFEDEIIWRRDGFIQEPEGEQSVCGEWEGR